MTHSWKDRGQTKELKHVRIPAAKKVASQNN